MDITVTFRHMEPSESIRLYAEDKISKLKKYFDSPIEAHVVLSVEKFRHTAEVTLGMDGTRINGAEETEDMYSAIDRVMDKIEVQVKRHRSRIKTRKSESIREGEAGLAEEGEEQGRAVLDEPSIEVERLVAKPMDVEEAAMQFGMGSQEFLVFRNSKTMDINVIYRRKDGNLGLIEPSA